MIRDISELCYKRVLERDCVPAAHLIKLFTNWLPSIDGVTKEIIGSYLLPNNHCLAYSLITIQ